MTDRYLPTSLAIALTAAVSAANAQRPDDDDALEAARACSEITDDADRLACLDEALGLAAPGAEPVAAEPPGAADAPTSDSRESRRSTRRAERERVAGSEPAESNEGSSAEPVTIRIVELRQSPIGGTTFVTDDGALWVQRSSNAGRFPSAPFDATLQPAMGDSFFLVSPLGGPRVRISRTR